MSSYDLESFERVRTLFPHTNNVVYFNTAAYGPFCTPVRNAIVENLDLRVAAEKDDTEYCEEVTERLRADFAWLVGAQPDDIGIGLNTSFGLNIAAYGLPLEAGDEVLVSDVEFPAIIYTWKAAAKERGLKLVFVPSKNRAFDIDRFVSLLTPRSKALCLSSVQFFNGYKNEIDTLARICKKRGMYFVLDAIQSLGVEPTDVKKLGVDILTSGCQKWLLSPQGCGFFYLSPEIRPKLHQVSMSWLSVDWQMKFGDLLRFNLEPFDSAKRFEMGYYVVFNLLGMKEAMNLFRELSIEAIQMHTYRLIDKFAAYLSTRSDMKITSQMDSKHRSAIFTFTHERHEELHRYLLSKRIIQVCREKSIRISVHLFNDDSDIERLIGALESFPK